MSEPEPRRWATCLLVIEDEPQIRRVVRHCLADEATRVLEAESGREGLALVAAERPELIVLDLGLPDLQGVDVCREIRRSSEAPIIVLSARHSDQEKVLLLDAGADDFITKPFSPAEFTARVRANLRRSQHLPLVKLEPRTIDGDLVIDLAAHTLARGGDSIHLTQVEWKLLQTFVMNAGRTLTHQQLFNGVWARSHGHPQQYLRVYVASLRRKIERDALCPCILLTEPGMGYRLEMPP
jgi:two-component system KDP operon response regulator KdpE